ncbi:MAG: hypothetical protein Q4F17_09455 [Eubacteriales bacterium]|nr:hypothetical protein [Eubacteriales bacterium]
MTQKPKIQYVGQFYVHGSEARALERQQRKAKTKLPQARVQRIERVYVDPVALVGIAVAVLMLAVMVLGALRIRDDWTQFERMQQHVYELKQQNLALNHQYRAAYDMEVIRSKAVGMGMVPREEAPTRAIRVTVPEPEAEATWLDDLKWFLDGLLPRS